MAMTVVELAQALDISVPQVEAALERLKIKGLVTQTSPEFDQCKRTDYMSAPGHAGPCYSCAIVGAPVNTNS